ncbi:hypothetical protein ACET3Z_008079 [Daucus carota]
MGRRAFANMYTIHEADEASIAAACEAEQKLESGEISGKILLILKWLAVVAAVLIQCATLVFIVVYSATEEHPGRLLILLLIMLMDPLIFWYAKRVYHATRAYIEAKELIKKAKELQDEMDKLTQRLQQPSRHEERIHTMSMGARRAIANMYTIAAACEAEQKLESGQISGKKSLILKWLAVVAAVLIQCATLVFIVVYSAIEEHPGRLLILLLIMLMDPLIYCLLLPVPPENIFAPKLSDDLGMGKRKSRAKPATRKRMDKLDTVFSCPFCNHGSSVECRIDMKNLIGEATCGICQESFSTTVTALTEPIDIYSEWIDECERVNTYEEDGAE